MVLIGKLETYTARPWNLLFEKEDLLVPDKKIEYDMDFEKAFEDYKKNRVKKTPDPLKAKTS